jgi:hypothetical protein
MVSVVEKLAEMEENGEFLNNFAIAEEAQLLYFIAELAQLLEFPNSLDVSTRIRLFNCLIRLKSRWPSEIGKILQSEEIKLKKS